MTEMRGQERLPCYLIPAAACSTKGVALSRGEVAPSPELAGRAQLPEGEMRQAVGHTAKEAQDTRAEEGDMLWVQTPSTASCLLGAEGAYCRESVKKMQNWTREGSSCQGSALRGDFTHRVKSEFLLFSRLSLFVILCFYKACFGRWVPLGMVPSKRKEECSVSRLGQRLL